MADIFHQFPIQASVEKVFEAVSTPQGLDNWWTLTSSGTPASGAGYELGFGSGYDWRAVVSRCVQFSEFELEMTKADGDWLHSKVGFKLENKGGITTVEFYHTGWPEMNDHCRISCFCWAMYLRLMKRYVERGEVVAYSERLEA